MIYRQVVLTAAIITGIAAQSSEAQERWQGAYGGVGLSAYEATTSIPGSIVHDFKDDGGSLTFYGGYNFVQESGFTWGPDVVLSAIDSPGGATDAVIGATSFEGSFLLNPRIRLGYAMEKAFFYGHLGLGISDLGIQGSEGGTDITIAPAIGFGLEYATGDLWSLRVEATGYAFDTDDRRINGTDRKLDGRVDQVVIGLTRSF